MKKRLALVCGTVGTALLPVVAYAESSSGTANTDVVTAMTTISNDMQATASSVIPLALSVVGIGMVVVFGIKIFKKIYNK